jgi:PEP-CTERM motif
VAKVIWTTLPRLLGETVLAVTALVFVGAVNAAVIEPGTQTTSVPAAIYDPLLTLTDPLPMGQFLLPIEITGASGLQDWSFDLTFDENVVAPLDVSGLYQSVYQAEFSAVDPTLSNITSSGLLGTGVLEGIAGFSSGVSGNGLLAFVLFEYLPDQSGNDPNFGIETQDPPIQQVPEPGTMLLLVLALLTLARMQRVRGRRLRVTAS